MSSPSPSQHLEQTRSHYLARLRQAIEDHAASDGLLQVVSEAALRGPAGELLRRGHLSSPVRVDLVTLLNGQVRDGMTIETETMPGFTPFSLRWKDTMPVRINPFPWHACGVRLLGDRIDDHAMIASFNKWFDKWFDVDDAKKSGNDGLLGVVHSVDKTPTELAGKRLLIDLGSAPLEAFEEMIDAAHLAGAEAVEIG